jgi:hypothetical protein
MLLRHLYYQVAPGIMLSSTYQSDIKNFSEINMLRQCFHWYNEAEKNTKLQLISKTAFYLAHWTFLLLITPSALQNFTDKIPPVSIL